MWKMIANIVYGLLSIGGGGFVLWKLFDSVGANSRFFLILAAVIVFAAIGFILISVYVPDAEPTVSSSTTEPAAAVNAGATE